MNKYIITETAINSEDGFHIGYGIACCTDGEVEVIAVDVSTEKEFVQSIVEKFNALDVSSEHAEDIIYDFII